MHQEYRRRVQFLLDERHRADRELQREEDSKRHLGWLARLLTSKERMVNELACRHLIHAIDIAMIEVSQHYWWHYTVSGRNPFRFPNKLVFKIVNQGLLIERTHTITCRYTNFMK